VSLLENSDIFKTEYASLPGQSDIFKTENPSLPGQSDNFKTENASLLGQSHIFKTENASLPGQSHIFKTENPSLLGQSRIFKTENASLPGQSHTFRPEIRDLRKQAFFGQKDTLKAPFLRRSGVSAERRHLTCPDGANAQNIAKVGTARCAVRAAFSGATRTFDVAVCKSSALWTRPVTSQRDVPTPSFARFRVFRGQRFLRPQPKQKQQPN
jgi:hypothetical protein